MDNDSQPRLPLYVPAFAKIYATFQPIAYPMLRIMIGLLFVPHGMQKLFQMFGGRSIAEYQGSFGRMGGFWAQPGWVYYIGCLEMIGGLMVAFGFFTRFAAVQLMLFMATATFIANAPRGWFWTSGGSEAPATWMIVLAYICVHGGGKCSVDNAIGKEI